MDYHKGRRSAARNELIQKVCARLAIKVQNCIALAFQYDV